VCGCEVAHVEVVASWWMVRGLVVDRWCRWGGVVEGLYRMCAARCEDVHDCELVEMGWFVLVYGRCDLSKGYATLQHSTVTIRYVKKDTVEWVKVIRYCTFCCRTQFFSCYELATRRAIAPTVRYPSNRNCTVPYCCNTAFADNGYSTVQYRISHTSSGGCADWVSESCGGV